MTSLGDQIDARGIDLDLDDGDIITDIVVVAECMTKDREKYLAVERDPHTNWLKEVGMLTLALRKIQDE